MAEPRTNTSFPYVFQPDPEAFLTHSIEAARDEIIQTALSNALKLYRQRREREASSVADQTRYVLFGDPGRDTFFSLERSSQGRAHGSAGEASVTFSVHLSSPISARVKLSRDHFGDRMLEPVMDSSTLGWRRRGTVVSYSEPCSNRSGLEAGAAITGRAAYHPRVQAKQTLSVQVQTLVDRMWQEARDEHSMIDSDGQPMTLTPSQIIQLCEFKSMVSEVISSGWEALFPFQPSVLSQMRNRNAVSNASPLLRSRSSPTEQGPRVDPSQLRSQSFESGLMIFHR